MISLVDHVEFLLARHDCVIVPGWGAFISQYIHSRSENHGIILERPERKISFNGALEHNDGLLVHSVMRRERVSYLHANEAVAQEVESLKKQLRHDGEVPFGRLGVFRQEANYKMSYFPFESITENDKYFGLLKKMEFHPLTYRNDAKVADVHSKKTKIVYIPIKRNYLQVAASIIVLLMLSIVLTTPVAKLNRQDYASLNTFTLSTSNVSVTTLPNKEKMPNIDLSQKKLDGKSRAQKEEQDGVINKKFRDSGMPCVSKGDYYLIVASLTSHKQAEKYIAESGDSGLQILDGQHKYRVYVANGTLVQLTKIKNHISTKHSDAWIYKAK